MVIGEQAYHECLRKESTLFNALYNAAGGAYGALRYPIDELSYVQPILHFAASFVFATLAFFGASRRRPAAVLAAALGCVAIFGTFPFGVGAYANYLSDAGEASVAAAYPSATYARLASIKAIYDPDNVFNQNQNIKPAANTQAGKTDPQDAHD